MTPEHIRVLLAQNTGKRVSMRSRNGEVSGIIHGTDGVHLLVRDSRDKERGRGPATAAQEGYIDRWGTPSVDLEPQFHRDRIVFHWQTCHFGEPNAFTLTIYL